MIRLLRFLITGDWHLHKWDDYTAHPMTFEGFTFGKAYVLRCNTCGKMKTFKVKA
jgi:hypothetical protein